MKTGNKDLDKWIKFFTGEKKSLTKYIYMLKNNDKTFLTKGFHQDVDSELVFPLKGFLEESFVKILKKEQKDLSQDYNLLILAAHFNVNFQLWKPNYKEKIYEVFENALIEGTYEEYGVDLDKIISQFIIKNLIDKRSFMAIAMLRGLNLGKRYDTEEKEKLLKKLVSRNNWKLKLGI